MLVECIMHLRHFTFVDHTIVAVHYIKNINIVDYEGIDKTHNNLNNKRMSSSKNDVYQLQLDLEILVQITTMSKP